MQSVRLMSETKDEETDRAMNTFADLFQRMQQARHGKPAQPTEASTVSPAFRQAFRKRSPGEHIGVRRQAGLNRDVREPVEARARAELAATELMPSVEPSAIARELGLSRFASVRALQRLRREFAVRNHPDRVPSSLRVRATQRMMIANALIDSAVKRFSDHPARTDRERDRRPVA